MNEMYLNKIKDFIKQDVIAVAGYSEKGENASHAIYDKFAENGNTVYAINPNHDVIKGVQCYPDLKSVPEKVGAVMLLTAPHRAMGIVEECRDLGIKYVWMHRSLGQGSFSQEATIFCKENGINCIAGGCPMMFIKPDPFHRIFKHVTNWAGNLKTEEAY